MLTQLAGRYPCGTGNKIRVPVEDDVKVGDPTATDQQVVLVVAPVGGPCGVAPDSGRPTDRPEIGPTEAGAAVDPVSAARPTAGRRERSVRRRRRSLRATLNTS